MGEETETEEIKAAVDALMLAHSDYLEFCEIYMREPAPGEIELIRGENRILTMERRAKDAVRPGIVNMLKYWMSQ